MVVSVLFYICSIDYETLKIEKKLLRYHENLVRSAHQQQELKWKEEELLISKNEENLGQDGHDLEEHDEGHESYESRVRAAFEHPNTEATFSLENSNDVLVMIQIQNSGSSNLEKKILRDLNEASCDCKTRRCQCIRPKTESDVSEENDKNKQHEDDDEDEDKELSHADYSPNWLFSRRTMGWPCGVHAGWTEMTSCVDAYMDSLEGYPFKRRYFYSVQLRHPIRRFLSEYFKIQSSPSKTNLTEKRICRRQPVVIPSCNFTTPSTTSLSDFIKCPVNLALNRQTRMLADLSLVNCYNQTGMSKKDYEFILLSSAKSNLHKMAFFSLDEYPDMSLQLFEQTFGLRFKTRKLKSESAFESRNDNNDKRPLRHRQLRSTETEDDGVKRNTQKFNNRKLSLNKRRKHYLLNDLPQELVDQVKDANRLDMELYDYAKELLFDRFDRRQVMLMKLDQKYSPKIHDVRDEEEAFDAEDGDDDDDDDEKTSKKSMTGSGHLRTNKLLRALNRSEMDALTRSN